MSKSEREEMFGKTKSGYLWCLHCERAYKDDDYREITKNGTKLEMCHYEDCSGDAVLDAWDWSEYEKGHSDVPKVPEIGKLYPLYPE